MSNVIGLSWSKVGAVRLKLLVMLAALLGIAVVSLALPMPALSVQAVPDQATAAVSYAPAQPAAPAALPPTLEAGGSVTIPVCLFVTYEGHGDPGTARWEMPVVTTIYTASTSSVIASWQQTTDVNGGYCHQVHFDDNSIQVDIQVKNSHTLSNKKLNISAFGPAIYINMGQLLEGDANDNDAVSIVDFSILRTTYGQSCPPCNKSADFNEDNVISILDFSLLRNNYGRSGPVPVAAPPLAPSSMPAVASASLANGVALKLVPSAVVVRSGEVAAIDVILESGAQPVDGADVYLNFDPNYLAIVDEHGQAVTQISQGSAFPTLLQNSVDAAKGLINFSAGILVGASPMGTLQVARFYVSPLQTSVKWTTVSFSSIGPRRTDVAFAGESILGQTEGGQVSAPSLRLWMPWLIQEPPALEPRAVR